MTAVAKLPAKWREEAADHDRHKDPLPASILRECADELEAALSPAELGGVESKVLCHRLHQPKRINRVDAMAWRLLNNQHLRDVLTRAADAEDQSAVGCLRRLDLILSRDRRRRHLLADPEGLGVDQAVNSSGDSMTDTNHIEVLHGFVEAAARDHNALSHDYVKDEKKCPRCKSLEQARAAITALSARASAEDAGDFASDTAALAFLRLVGNGNPNIERAVKRLHSSLIARASAGEGGVCPLGVECAKTNPEFWRCIRESQHAAPQPAQAGASGGGDKTNNAASNLKCVVPPKDQGVITDHILSNYVPVPESGCWLWLGGWNPDGYGNAGHKHKAKACAHRLFFTHFVGEIPSGLMVCHKCDTPACVNPAHLFLGTNQDNMRDMAAKGRSSGQKKVRAAMTARENCNV